MAEQQPDDGHEHVFVEEREPSGRLVLPPCLLCDMAAFEALSRLRDERDRATPL